MCRLMKKTSTVKASEVKPEAKTKEIEIVESLALVISCGAYDKCKYEPLSIKGRDNPIVTIADAHKEAADAVTFYRHFGDNVIHIQDPSRE